MPKDSWLPRWTALFRNDSTEPAILELGCGGGRDTTVLAAQGFTRLTVTDLSPLALDECRRAAPAAQPVCHDLRTPLPFADGRFDVILASLCLHYFDWEKTGEIVREIRRCLAPHGLLLCRLNSTRDVHYGAIGHREIALHYYEVDGRTKRFFDRADIDALFAHGWQPLAIEEMTIERYALPKTVWEAVLRKSSPQA